MSLPPIPMNTFDVMEADPRWRNSTVTAFFEAPLKRAKRGQDTEWVVCVRTGSIIDHHRFDDRDDALAFARKVSPDFEPRGDA